MPYSIGEFARLCGINATTLRAWQRRYGLLKPLRTDGGHRLYSDDDVQQALKILDWVKKGVPVSQVKPLLSRPGARRTNNWLTLQETMLQRLKEGKIESLRQLIYDAGREYPRQELVTEVLLPLRSQVSANVPARAIASTSCRCLPPPWRRRFFPSATGCWSPAANSPLPARGRSNSGSSRSSPSR